MLETKISIAAKEHKDRSAAAPQPKQTPTF